MYRRSWAWNSAHVQLNQNVYSFMWTGTVVINVLRIAGTILLCSLLCVFNSQHHVGEQSALYPTCNGVHNRIVLQHIHTTFSNTHLYSPHFTWYPKGFPTDPRLSYQFPLGPYVGSSIQVRPTWTMNQERRHQFNLWETTINPTPKAGLFPNLGKPWSIPHPNDKGDTATFK